eukprot:3429726-Rhodomonas_salina.1
MLAVLTFLVELLPFMVAILPFAAAVLPFLGAALTCAAFRSGMSQFSSKDVQIMHVLSTQVSRVRSLHARRRDNVRRRQAGTLLYNREKHEEAVSETVSGILH